MRRRETEIMKTLISVAALLLSASTAMAEAPCENPVTPACRQACAAMGAKYVLLMREPNLLTAVRVQADNVGSLDNTQRLARFAGLSLPYIASLTVQQINGAIALSCPR
jgi:hypothetical protein